MWFYRICGTFLNDRRGWRSQKPLHRNFKLAAGRSDDKYYGTVFVDTDLYKWVESVSYTLSAEKIQVGEIMRSSHRSDRCSAAT